MKFLFLAAALTVPALSAQAESERSLQVNGTGEVSVAPDIARLTLGVTAQDDVAATAIAQMNDDLAAVLDRLADSGLPPEDIQTSALRLDVQQDYASSDGRGEITGFLAQSTVHVTVRDLDALGDIIGQAVTDGANTLNGLSFDLADRGPQLDEARRRAVTDAAARAALYAEAAGVTLGDLVSLSEEGGSSGPMPMQARAFEDSGSVPVAPGEIVISAGVSLVYAIGEE
ncbi:MAG: SIMPL domain-containing protein [Paracoccaceae bacterium]